MRYVFTSEKDIVTSELKQSLRSIFCIVLVDWMFTGYES